MNDPANLPTNEREGEPPADVDVSRNVAPWAPSGPPGEGEGPPSSPGGPGGGRPKADRGKTPFEGTRTPAPLRRGAIKILFVAANALPERQLQLERECRELKARLRAARHRKAFELVECWGATLEDVRQHLLEHTPDVVHFAAHGSEGAELMLLDDRGRPSPVPADALASLFHVFRNEVRLVVVNACFGSEQVAALRESVGLAVGMRGEVSDRVAIGFSGAFYEALGYGRSVREAFDLGVSAARAVNASQGRAPRLLEAEGVDASKVFFIGQKRAHRLGRDVALAASLCASGAFAVALLARAPPYSAPPRISLSSYEGQRPSPFDPAARPPAVVVEGGEVTVGTIDEAKRPPECKGAGGDDDCTAAVCPGWGRSVSVARFSIDATEVTNEDFARWLEGAEGSWHLGKGGFGVVLTNAAPPSPLAVASDECGGGLAVAEGGGVLAMPGRERKPVVCVTWQGASEYCRAQGKRLPAEAEWELAAKGPLERPFPWGSEVPRDDRVAFGGKAGALDGPRNVASSPLDCSPEGVYDLGGNVAEWVQDGDGVGRKALRGGSWWSTNACGLLTSISALRPPKTYAKDLGFRCASDVSSGTQKRFAK